MPVHSARVTGRLRPTLASSSVAVVIIAVSVLGFFLTSRSTSDQERTLLKSETNQAAVYASELFAQISSLMNQAAAVVRLTHGSPKAFAQVATGAPAIVIALVRKAGDSYVVEAGTGLRRGDVLSAAQVTTVAKAAPEVVAGPVSFHGKLSTLRFAVGGSALPSKLAIYEQISLNPFTVTSFITGHAFNDLNAVLYGSDRANLDHLVASTTPTPVVAGEAARAKVAVGSSNWLLVAAARHSLIGGFAAFSPTIVLLLGIAVALISGTAIEISQRRRRYANSLVEARTADLNRSLEELRRAQGALVRSERLAAVGEMATVVGHELRNPLAAVMNGLYLVRSHVSQPMPELVARNLAMAEREAEKAARLADDLTAFVRPRETIRSAIEARELVDEVLAASPPPAGVEVTVEAEAVTFLADRGQLAEILTNLVVNAYQALPQGGDVQVSVRSDGDGVRLVVEDSGPGVEDSVAARLFEPFFTTRARGTGLGLAVVQRLVTAHDGEVSCDRAPAGGARFTVVLPRCREGFALMSESASDS